MRCPRSSTRFALSLLVLGVSLSPVCGSGGTKVNDLRARLERLAQMMRSMEQRIQDSRRQERRVTDDLNTVQQKLDTAKTELEASRLKLVTARDAVAAAAARLQLARARLSLQRQRFSQRVRASYVQGPVSYADVLLGARDVNDFLDRQYFVDRIMARDAEILTGLRIAQGEVAAEHTALQSRQQALAAVHAEVALRQVALGQRRQEQATLLARVRSQRQLQEQELEELEADSQRITRELQAEQRRRAAARIRNPKLPPLSPWTGNFLMPASGPITSRFGWRFHPILKKPKMHPGVDIGAPFGSPIRAAASGEVLSAGWNGAYGKCIILLHGGLVSTVYGHCSSLAVSAGQNVRRGQVIGYVGSTGRSTGPHLHFEVRRNGVPVNPF